jgi:hypothetical protein
MASFSSWSSLNEAIAKGKDVIVDPVTGKKHKVTYKVQNRTKFIVKIINDLDILDDSGKLTQSGINALVAYLNEEDSFTMAIGQITPTFFQTKFVVYTVLRDGELFGRTKQKIQFEIQDKLGADGKPKYPNLAEGTQFIDADSFKAASELAQPIVQNLIQTAQQTTLPDPGPADTEQNQTQTTNTETVSDKDKKFLYTMRSNNKLYLMQFMENGNLNAKTKDNSDPNGIVSYDKANKKVLWSTSLDDSGSKDAKLSKEKGTPLFYDMEIINSQDKSFFEKIFTDAAFRKKIIDEYEREYASSELTPANLRNMLFYKDGKSIFGSNVATSGGATTNAADQAKINSLVSQFQKLGSTESPSTTTT